MTAARLCGQREVRLTIDGYTLVYQWDEQSVRYRFDPGAACDIAPSSVIAQLTVLERSLMLLLPEFAEHPVAALVEGRHYRLPAACLPTVRWSATGWDASQIDGRVLVLRHDMFLQWTRCRFFDGSDEGIEWKQLWPLMRAGLVAQAE